MTLSAKLISAMAALVVLTALAVGLVAYYLTGSQLAENELSLLRSHSQLAAAELQAQTSHLDQQVLTLSRARSLAEFVRTHPDALPTQAIDAETHDAARENLLALFYAQMQANPDLLQIRLIGIKDDGREIIRVERTPGSSEIVLVDAAALQQKGPRDYFQETLKVPSGQVYLSPMELNEEFGQVTREHTPVMRLGTTIENPEADALFGILVFNVDMTESFASLRDAARPGAAIRLANPQGEILVDPEPSREFGFQLGKSYRVGDEFPAIALRATDLAARAEFVNNADGSTHAVSVAPLLVNSQLEGWVIESIPEDLLLAPLSGVQRSVFFGAAATMLVALLLAIFTARSLASPLTRLASAVSDYSGRGEFHIPEKLPPEIHNVAASVDELVSAVEVTTEQLRQEVRANQLLAEERGQLLAQAALYSTIANSADDAIVAKTLDGVITAWNPGAERIFGYSAAEAVGQKIEIIVPAERREELKQILARLRQGERIDHHITQRRAKDGRLIDVSLSISPLRAADGRITGAAKIARDMTAQLRLEQRFRLAVDASPNGILLVNDRGEIVLSNAACLNMFGYAEGELVGEQVECLVPAAIRVEHVKLRQSFARAPESRAMGAGRDLRGLRKDGALFPVEVGLALIHSTQENLVLVTIVDISLRVATAEELSEKTVALERSLEDLRAFTHVASHDLKAPLNGIKHVVTWLQEDFGETLPESSQRHLKLLNSRTLRMEKLISELLLYSQADRMSSEPEHVDVRRLAESVVELASAPEEFTFQIDSEVRSIITHRTPLQHVLLNLVTNAVKHHDRPDGRIEITLTKAGSFAKFRVADDGPGIAEKYHERIFEAFQTLKPKDEVEGSGLGLAIVRRIVESFGGTIELESELGQGATFTFTWPTTGGES